MSMIHARPAPKSPELRRRNRRLATMLFAALIIATVLCGLYIAFFGGMNKGPMKPFHSSNRITVADRA